MPTSARRIELTRRGWSLCGAACGLVITSRLLGVIQLLVLGVVGLVLLGASLVWVRSVHPALDLGRTVTPARIHVGGDGRVDLAVTNRGSTTTPLLSLDERFGDGRRAARFLLPPVGPGDSARAAYRVPTLRRGRYAIGPMVVSLSEPFGLAKLTSELGPIDQVTVYPRIHDLASPPLGGGGLRASADAARARSVTLDGDEFAALREYEIGDDLRKVHWPATARTGELFIRQDASYREPHVVVVLDTRADAHDHDSFEAAVEVVASLLVRLTRDGRRVAVGTTSGAVLCKADDGAVGLDRLSTVALDASARVLDATVGSGQSLVVVVTGRVDAGDIGLLRRAVQRHQPVLLVTTAVATGAAPAPAATRAGIIHVDASGPDIAGAWNRTVLARTRTAAPRAASVAVPGRPLT
jgi:uncharacterized protein (DUF58 family)